MSLRHPAAATDCCTRHQLTPRGVAVVIAFYATLFVVGLGIAGGVEADLIPISVGLVYGIGVTIVVAAFTEIGRRL